MATPLARLSSSAPALRALSAASSWNLSTSVDAILNQTFCGKPESSAVPSPAAPLPSGALLALGNRQRHALTAFGSNGLWVSSPRCHGGRSFATQGEPPPPPAPQPPPAASAPSASPPPGSDPGSRPPNDVVYEGPLSQQHKLLKRISIANTLIAAAAGPAIIAFADNISLTGRYGLATSLAFFGLITTGALHWVAHPYVHELRYTAATGQLDVRTTTLLGNSRWHSFNVDDVRPLPWDRPVATFAALGQFYYIDVHSFPDEQLLRRLTPDEADVPQGYKDKDDDDD